MPDLTVVLILVLAAFVHGAFGFGFPLVATPLLMLAVEPEPLRVLLALVLIAYLVADRFIGGDDPEHSIPKWGLALLGLFMGLMAGVVNVFAPIVVVFALYTRMDPLLMVAAFNLSFVTSKSGQLTSFFVNGAIDPEIMILSLWVLPPVVLSLWLGIRLRKRIDPEAYKGLLRYSLWGIAFLLMFEWARGLT